MKREKICAIVIVVYLDNEKPKAKMKPTPVDPKRQLAKLKRAGVIKPNIVK